MQNERNSKYFTCNLMRLFACFDKMQTNRPMEIVAQLSSKVLGPAPVADRANQLTLHTRELFDLRNIEVIGYAENGNN